MLLRANTMIAKNEAHTTVSAVEVRFLPLKLNTILEQDGPVFGNLLPLILLRQNRISASFSCRGPKSFAAVATHIWDTSLMTGPNQQANVTVSIRQHLRLSSQMMNPNQFEKEY